VKSLYTIILVGNFPGTYFLTMENCLDWIPKGFLSILPTVGMRRH